MNENELRLRKHFENLYGKEIVEKLLESNELRFKDKNILEEEIKIYKRWEKFSDNCFKIKGCIYCIENADDPLAIRNQDFPGWKGLLRNKDLIVIGLEVGPQVKTDFHIAYNLGVKIKNQDRVMYENIGILFENFEDRAYITDLAKCNSTKLNNSRKECMERNFFKELELASKIIKPSFKIIIQSFDAETYFKNINIRKILVARKNPGEKPKKLCKFGNIEINNRLIDVIIVPHSGRRVTDKWNMIREPINLEKIKSDRYFKKVKIN